MAAMPQSVFTLVVYCVVLASSGPAWAAPAEKAGIDFFEQKIRPVLVQKCYACHSSEAKKVKGGLLLDTREGLLKGGETGPTIVAGNVENSPLLEAIRYEGLEMPPSGKLPEQVIADFEKWVKMGAPDPRDGKAIVVSKEIDFDEARKFWAFQPPKASPPVTSKDVTNKAWPKTEIDRYVLATLEAKGLSPVADADRPTLLRRVTFDLTGLLPTPAELQAFVSDKSADAYAKVVDRLLASPQFGERWARHWLDVVRYAESTGKERNVPYHYAWRYRDWVIDALNSDKPYDRFITEQIAGDLLPYDGDEERNAHLVATGFLTLGPKGLNERNAEQFTMDVVDEQLDVTCRAMLGFTVACARCHDHKFDPVPTSDYYALAGIFRSTRIHSGVSRGSRTSDEKELLAMALLKPADATAPADEAPPAANSTELDTIDAQIEKLRAEAKEKIKKAEGNAKTKEVRQQDVNKALKAKIKQLQNRREKLTTTPVRNGAELAMAASEAKPTNCRICIRGEVNDLGPEVPRGFITVLKTSGDPQINTEKSGRLELARWITSRENPLTARVMVNRIWHHLFGAGIVETVDNFGKLGERPTHPELLDRLALDFMEQGWSVKQAIRSMVLSRTYQLGSEHQEAGYAIDPANRLLWRMSRRRLDAEAMRDAMLVASGQIDLSRPQGSGTLQLGGGEIGRGLDLAPVKAESKHRSIYLPVLRGVVPEMLAVFDLADPNNVVGQREVTTVATQALYMMNSPFVMQRSAEAASRVLQSDDADELARADLAYQLILARPASDTERNRAVAFVQEYRQSLADAKADQSQLDAWTALCQTLFASAEFRYLY